MFQITLTLVPILLPLITPPATCHVYVLPDVGVVTLYAVVAVVLTHALDAPVIPGVGNGFTVTAYAAVVTLQLLFPAAVSVTLTLPLALPHVTLILLVPCPVKLVPLGNTVHV